MTDIAELTEIETVTHPSGWRKASNGRWYPPDDGPRPTPVASNDQMAALSLAVGAIVFGSFLPWARMLVATVHGTDGNGNLTLLLGGVAGALIARWRIDGGIHRGLMTASLVLCAAASAVLLYDVVRITRVTAVQPQSGIFLATAGALTATALTTVLRGRTVAVAATP